MKEYIVSQFKDFLKQLVTSDKPERIKKDEDDNHYYFSVADPMYYPAFEHDVVTNLHPDELGNVRLALYVNFDIMQKADGSYYRGAYFPGIVINKNRLKEDIKKAGQAFDEWIEASIEIAQRVAA